MAKTNNSVFFSSRPPRSTKARIGHFAQRTMFVLVGACFVVAFLITIFQTVVETFEPQLVPAVASTTLQDNPLVPENENGISIQKNDMTMLEMPTLMQPTQLDPKEVLHIKAADLHSVVLRPKVFDNMSDYKLYKIENGQQTLYGDIHMTIVPGTHAIHIAPGAAGWAIGDYMLQIPIPSGMFGGQYFTYFTVMP